MRTRRPAVVLGLVALTTTILTAPAGAKGGPSADAGPLPGAGPNPEWVIPETSLPAGCEDEPGPIGDNCDVVAPVDLAAAIDDGAGGVQTVVGEVAGAAYVGQAPADWDGERLLVWAHGYRGEFEDNPYLTVDPPPLFDDLVAEGTAWIASSYRRNSYDPGIGVIDTKNVVQRAGQLFGAAEHTYVAGVSMGGHVIGAAVEQYPELFDGALPVCGVMGDVELFDYFLDYNLGAAAIAGVPAEYPDTDWVGDEVVAIKAALSLHDDVGLPGRLWAFDGSPLVGGTDLLAGPGEDFKDFVELGSGGVRADLDPDPAVDLSIYDVAWDYWHVAGAGDFFFALGEGTGTIANRSGVVGQNSDTVYGEEYGEAFASLDDTIERVTASNRVRDAQGTKPAPIINGTPGIPVLTMHTIGDLFVPIEMQQIYAREVAANGLGDNLVQRAIRDVGHCTFSEGEWDRAYADLFAWVEDGVRPAGDDFTDPDLLANPLVGLPWTVNDGTAPSGAVRLFGP